MTPEQERAEARIDKAKLLEYLRKEKSFTNALMSERWVYASLINKVESGQFNSLDREEQLIKEVSRLNAELKTACRGLDIRLDEINKQRDKVAEQDKEIQSWKDRADRAETILEKIMHGDQS